MSDKNLINQIIKEGKNQDKIKSARIIKNSNDTHCTEKGFISYTMGMMGPLSITAQKTGYLALCKDSKVEKAIIVNAGESIFESMIAKMKNGEYSAILCSETEILDTFNFKILKPVNTTVVSIFNGVYCMTSYNNNDSQDFKMIKLNNIIEKNFKGEFIEESKDNRFKFSIYNDKSIQIKIFLISRENTDFDLIYKEILLKAFTFNEPDDFINKCKFLNDNRKRPPRNGLNYKTRWYHSNMVCDFKVGEFFQIFSKIFEAGNEVQEFTISEVPKNTNLIVITNNMTGVIYEFP